MGATWGVCPSACQSADPSLPPAAPSLAAWLPACLQVGAPLRPVTVRDAIADLPAITNGHAEEEMEYDQGPVSGYVGVGWVWVDADERTGVLTDRPPEGRGR